MERVFPQGQEGRVVVIVQTLMRRKKRGTVFGSSSISDPELLNLSQRIVQLSRIIFMFNSHWGTAHSFVAKLFTAICNVHSYHVVRIVDRPSLHVWRQQGGKHCCITCLSRWNGISLSDWIKRINSFVSVGLSTERLLASKPGGPLSHKRPCPF